MTHVATLIAPDGALDNSVVDRARTALGETAAPVWLAPATAVDVPFAAAKAARTIAEELRALLGGLDVVVQAAQNRRKRLFLADMDSTMIGQECIDELADFAGLKPRIALITERAMRGEIEFEPALRERVALLKGLPAALIDQIIDQRIRLTSGAGTLVATMRKNGAYTCLVTGGFTLFAQKIGKMIGFDEMRANRLKLDPDGHLSGLVEEPVFGRDAKLATLVELRERLGLGRDHTMAIGDGANDLDMIAEAGLGVAFHAKPKLAEAAAARIDHNDLTALLYVQGYNRDEFAEP
jgi:phosphoserine phosphatase